jgi:hypothetical protein
MKVSRAVSAISQELGRGNSDEGKDDNDVFHHDEDLRFLSFFCGAYFKINSYYSIAA